MGARSQSKLNPTQSIMPLSTKYAKAKEIRAGTWNNFSYLCALHYSHLEEIFLLIFPFLNTGDN
jgi:hypothetical protein